MIVDVTNIPSEFPAILETMKALKKEFGPQFKQFMLWFHAETPKMAEEAMKAAMVD